MITEAEQKYKELLEEYRWLWALFIKLVQINQYGNKN